MNDKSSFLATNVKKGEALKATPGAAPAAIE
jgi:hypothetical protein